MLSLYSRAPCFDHWCISIYNIIELLIFEMYFLMFNWQSKMRTIDVDLPLYVRLQRLFYIVSPNASMFENLDEVPNYVREVSTPEDGCSVVLLQATAKFVLM